MLGRVKMYAPFWSYILASIPCICMVGLVTMMSLFGLHSFVFSVRFGAMMVGRINL